MAKTLLRAVLGLSGLYLLVCLLVALGQRGFMYFPARASEEEALRRARSLGLVPWRDDQGRLLGWRPERRGPAPWRILVFHGNAGSALDRHYYPPLFDPARFDVVLFEYPGYGPRGGSPSEALILAEAGRALDLLRGEGPVLILGESLGGGVACRLAGDRGEQVGGLLLVTPFARMAEVAGRHYPWLPVGLLLRDRWDALAAIRSFRGPVAVLLAGRDEVVGADQGWRLAKGCPGPVRVWEQPLATHNDLDLGSREWQEMVAFLD